jgi:DNA-directed RNA polymerase specialized sigma24 family protein
MKKMFRRFIDLFRSKKEEVVEVKVVEVKKETKPKAKKVAKKTTKTKSKKKVNITAQMKKSFVKDREKGLSYKDIGEKHGIPTSTVTYHVKNSK